MIWHLDLVSLHAVSQMTYFNTGTWRIPWALCIRGIMNKRRVEKTKRKQTLDDFTIWPRVSSRPNCLHSWPLNNTSLNDAGPLTRRFFSGMNTTIQRDSWLVESADAEPWILRNLRYRESTTSSADVPLCRGQAPLTPRCSRVDCIEIAVYPQIWGTIAYKHASLWYHLCVRKTGVFKLDTWCVNQETTCSKVKFIWNHQSKSIPKSVSTTKREQLIGRMGFCHNSHTYESLHTSWASIFLNV